ncbi:MAG: DNA repair protein RecN [Clostridiales bacterium]|nr:DNA repair protein RecN [Clostridiales bacterium]
MIRHISIRNFAIIENVEIDFNDGLNIITGETGAGKSVVIEAVSLALGSRADTAFVRTGADKAVIQLVATADGDEYVITREVSAAGRSLCRINDEIVTLGTLSQFCRSLADIHGQYDHQSLLDPDNHIRLVDLYRKDSILPAKATVSALYAEYTGLCEELARLRRAQAEGKRQRDFMDFELKEIEDAHLVEGEDDALEDEISLLQNSEKIFSSLAGAYQTASESDYSILSAMRHVSDMVGETSEYTKDLAELSQRLESLYYEYEDACTSLRDLRDGTVYDPAALDEAINRYETIKRLKEKHGRTIPELLAYADELRVKLSSIDNADEEIASLQTRIDAAAASLAEASETLSSLRRASASELETLITEQLSQLNFRDAAFAIDFRKAVDAAGNPQFTAEGTDIVEFLITTNRGEPLKPLSKIASGGEMSRIMLAFKKIIGDYDHIPTMIFDEIDSGISGIAASVVGRKLREIAERHQIICITHLPQIAAYGTSNYRIWKHSDDLMTFTSVDPLDPEEKVREIARLLGGETITETTLASARELIEASK